MKNTAPGNEDSAGRQAPCRPAVYSEGPGADSLKRGFVAYGVQEDLARYRVVRGSLSSKPKRSAAWTWSVYREVEKLGLLHAGWCMLHYGARAVLKRLVF